MSPRTKDKIHKTDTVKWRIFMALMGFSLGVIVLLWVLQIFLLDQFYYYTVRGKMHLSTSQILSCDAEQVPDVAERIALKGQFSVTIYRIENIDGQTSAYNVSRIINSGSILDDLTAEDMNLVFRKANEDPDGRIILNSKELEAVIGHFEVEDDTDAPDRLLSVALRTSSSGDLLYILLDTTLTPLDPTVSTLQNQLGFISIILFLMAVIVSLALASLISRPLKKLNVAAKDLANGNYSADFETGGYREVVELSESLTYAADELSKVDRLQKELLANISHDLRTPLTMIIGYGEVMRDIDGENTPENVQVIIDEAVRLSTLVNDLLEISSYQAGNENIARDAIDIAETVREIANRYQHLKERGGYSIIAEGETSAWIYADKKRILQVICNLVNNAINYAGEDKTVIITCHASEDAVRVSVTDHGVGIPESELQNIWQRYYKVDKTHVRGVMGSGLGLSIVKRILELHGARYGVDSRVGEGSTFWFELPRYTPPNELPPHNHSEET